MAERRMFAKTIIDSDAFLDMPQSTQLLYFHLAMRADDDGFINNPKKIQRTIGASDDDAKILVSKKFIIPFESGIVVIKHWKIHNYIAKDRYTETKYKDEKSLLGIDVNNSYTRCIQPVHTLETQVRLGEVRLGEDRIGEVNEEAQPQETFSLPVKRPLIPANNVSSRIEKHRVTWNYLGLPEMRRTFPTFTEYERTDCINTATFYTDEEIEKAINNYAEILKSPDHEIFKKFEKFTGFMARGVERFIDSATPFDRCRKKTMDRTPEQEDNSKYDALMRVQE